MKNIKNFAVAFSSLAFLATTTPLAVQAQESTLALEEILVTGRKREESLTEVPVSISVWSSANLKDAGILTQQDLFDATPGLTFDSVNGDRNSSNPSIRGVQAAEVTTTLQKVNTFIDGIPLLGQANAITFSGVDRVEVYRGPQSAAFGRSTFAGAINYVTEDSSDEFEASLSVRASDLGANELGLILSGPISDRLGYRVSYVGDEFTGPDEWTATDGVELGSEETRTFSAKLNFEITDSIYGEIAYTRLDQDDLAPATWFLSQDDCNGDSANTVTSMMGTVQLFSGEFDCDIFSSGPERNHDVLGQFRTSFDQNREFYEATAVTGFMGPTAVADAQAAFDAVDTDGNGEFSVEEYLAQELNGVSYEDVFLGQTVDPFTVTERDRYQGELNFEVGDNLLTFLGMYSDEFSNQWSDGDVSDTLGVITVNGMGVASLGMNTNSMGSPSEIEEKYLEVRWVSPDDQRLRYTLSASHYEYDVLSQVFLNYGAIAYDLTFDDDDDDTTAEVAVDPNRNFIVSNSTSNQGIAFGLNYDITEHTTFSLEGRYQQDENCGEDLEFDISACTDNNSFAPRIAITTQLTENSNIYAQLSQGTNPGGINIIFANPNYIEAIDIANGSIAVPDFDEDGIATPNPGVQYNGLDGNPAPFVNFSADDFESYDEEELTSFEIGYKGTIMDGRASFATAIYYTEWDDQISAFNVDWDDDSDVSADNPFGGWNQDDWNDNGNSRAFFNAGDARIYGLEFDGSFLANEMFTLGLNFSYINGTYTDYCSPNAGDYADADGAPLFDIQTPAEDGVNVECAFVNGNELPRQSEFTGAFDVTATLPDIFGMRTSVRADVRHTGAYFQDDINLIKRAATNKLNLSATMRGDDLTLRLSVNNLTDNEEPRTISAGSAYSDAADPSAAAAQTGGYLITPNRPRELAVSLTYDF